MDQIQHLSDPPGVQSPTTLVIHGRRNMRKNGLKAIHRAQSPKRKRKPSLPIHQIPVCRTKESWNNLKMRGRMAFKYHFSLFTGRGARGTEGRHFRGRITFPKFDHYTKSWSSSLTIRHGKYPKEDDPPQHQPKPRKVEESWSSTPPSGPWRVVQQSTANSITKNDLRRHQLRPMTKRVTKKMRQGWKDQEISHGRPNQYHLKWVMMKSQLVISFIHWSRWTSAKSSPRQH